MLIPNQTSTVMNVWLLNGHDSWMCVECYKLGGGKPPTVCPQCHLPVMANVVYAKGPREDGA